MLTSSLAHCRPSTYVTEVYARAPTPVLTCIPEPKIFRDLKSCVMRSCLATLVHIVVPATDAHARDDFFYPVSLCCRLLDEGCNPYSTGVRCSSVPVILRVLKPSRSRRCFRSIPASPSCCSNVSEVYTRKVRSTGLCRKRSLRLTLP